MIVGIKINKALIKYHIDDIQNYLEHSSIKNKGYYINVLDELYKELTG